MTYLDPSTSERIDTAIAHIGRAIQTLRSETMDGPPRLYVEDQLVELRNLISVLEDDLRGTIR